MYNLHLEARFPPPSLFHEIILFSFTCIFKIMLLLSIIRDNVLIYPNFPEHIIFSSF